MNIEFLSDFSIFILGTAIALTAILGVTVFIAGRRSITNQTFLAFSLFTIIWNVLNFLLIRLTSPDLVLWLLRVSIFFATWHAFSFLQLFYVFPAKNKQFAASYKFFLLPVVVFTSFLTLTPFVFSEIAGFSAGGQVASVKNGPGIIVFALVVISSILGGFFFLLKKFIKSSALEKIQFKFILLGASLTFFLLLTFNFILPAFFDQAQFVQFGAVFIFPFIALTAYAIVKYRLFNIKVIATEILTFVLAIVTLLEVILSNELGILIFRISIFVLVLSFGILLIRSVRKEVEQREQLESLTKKLEAANEELKRLDKAKSEFVSIASHQLRTPLTATKGYISLVLEGTYGSINEKFKKPLQNVYYSNERLIHLVNDLLSLSRIESGKMTLEKEPTDISEIVKSVIDELQIKAEEKGLRLILEKSTSAPPQVLLDKEKIRNVVLNLIDNAIRYTKQGSITTSIKVSPFGGSPVGRQDSNTKDGNIVISVTDTGEGMTKAEIAKLFESFSRGQAGEKLSMEGAGLGLYIARQFVEMHKGKIRATSEGKGKGSTFHVELPVAGG